MEEQTKSTEAKMIVYKRECPYCKTKVISMYEKQLAFNYGVHVRTCNQNPLNKKEETQ